MKEVSALSYLHNFSNLDINWKSKIFLNVLVDPWKILQNLLESDAERGFALILCFFSWSN